jgi:GNAT superfamily N-acetyltransferase
MRVKSLGYRTDLIFPGFDGEILDCGDYLVVTTPSNPSYYWGNYLLFSRPPGEDDFDKWLELFAQEIGAPPEVVHQTFGWDSPQGEQGVVQPFLQAGFRLLRHVVMVSGAPQPPASPSSEVTIRSLTSDFDWVQALENQVLCREPEHEATEYRRFRQREVARYRRMAEAGLGDWFGAFAGDQLVADLGIFKDREVGRFQSVGTHPEFRRRGIAGSMVFEAGHQAIAKHDLKTLVMVAEMDSSAARLYESLGFKPTERQVGLEWWP